MEVALEKPNSSEEKTDLPPLVKGRRPTISRGVRSRGPPSRGKPPASTANV